MKTTMKSSAMIALGALALTLSPAFGGDTEGENCAKVYKEVLAKVTKKQDEVLSIMSDAIAANEKCTCEIVQAAIKGSEADSEAVGQIVEAAIAAAGSMANTIVECATAVAPDAIGEIEAAYARAMGNAAGGGYTLSPVALGGVYLLSPSAPAGMKMTTVTEEVIVMKPGSRTTDSDASPSKPD